MRLTTKGRFAVTAMLDVAMYGQSSPVTLANIAERQRISLSYLEQLFGRLRRQALVESVRGPGGGYQLSKAAGETSVAEIIHAVEEPLDSRQCGGKENCHGESRCMTHDLWEDLNQTVHSFLAGVTLSDLIARGEAAQAEQKAKETCSPITLVRHEQSISTFSTRT
jgi:Rrf2 family transcriptional regulator, iron-sulfur cluster assembly transcription factor